MRIMDQFQDDFPERDIFRSKGDFERRAFPYGTYYTFPKFRDTEPKATQSQRLKSRFSEVGEELW